jgi:RNA polymerase sigma-70 factor (ECF subfamily)
MARLAMFAGSMAGPQAAKADVTARFEDLYRSHARTVWRWAQRLGGPGTEVEDIVQEVFLCAYRGLASFRGDSDARTWLYPITARLAARQRRRRRKALLREGTPEAPPAGPFPDEAIRAREAEALLYRALDRLSEKQRALLVAFELDELSGPEIARALAIKPATLWVQLHRARCELRRKLEIANGH